MAQFGYNGQTYNSFDELLAAYNASPPNAIQQQGVAPLGGTQSGGSVATNSYTNLSTGPDPLQKYRSEIQNYGTWTPELEAAAKAYMETPEYQQRIAEAKQKYDADMRTMFGFGGSDNAPSFDPNNPLSPYAVNPYVKGSTWDGNVQTIQYRDDTSHTNAPYEESYGVGGLLGDVAKYGSLAILASLGGYAAMAPAAGAGGMTVAEAGALGGESFIPGVTGAGAGATVATGGTAGIGATAATGATPFAVDSSLIPGFGTAGAATSFAVDPSLALASASPAATEALTAASAGSGLTTLQYLKKLAADEAAKQTGEWTTKDYIAAASLGILGAGTLASMFGGGDQTTSATTTSDTRSQAMKEQALIDFNNYIDNFYGTSGGKSVEERLAENTATQQGYESDYLKQLSDLNTQYLANTTEAVDPYKQQLADILNQSQTGTGYFNPLNLTTSSGGTKTPLASFVPKPQLNAMSSALDVGRTSSSVNTGLADLAYNKALHEATSRLQFGSAHPANEAADAYTQALAELMKYTNAGGSTSTTTGTVPGEPWYSTLLQGLNTGVNFYDKIYNPRPTSYTFSVGG